MKKQVLALCALLLATVAVAQSGLTCEDAIVLKEDYRANIAGPCEVWYTVSSYNLPLHVRFSPISDNSQKGPDVEVDLTCVPGVYEDPKIDSLVNMVSDFDVTFPIPFSSELSTGNGRNEWDLPVNKSYRDQLAAFGVLYSVPAYVKVKFYEAGTISLSPDKEYENCMTSSRLVELDDTLAIAANDEQSVFVFPYTAWKNDSIRFVWTGDGQADVYVAEQECQFMPTVSDPYVFSAFTISADAPHKLYTDQMKDFISNHTGEGIFYAKVVASSAGKLVVEKIPMAAAAEGAEMLELGKTVKVASADQLYCFPRTWTSTEFTAPQGNTIQMFVSTSEEFTASVDDPNVIAVHDFAVVEGKRTLQLSSMEMEKLTDEAVGDYLYVRFVSDGLVAITPVAWNVSECVDKSILISPNKLFAVAAKSRSVLYRARYSDFSNYDLKITWTGNSTLPTYIAEVCDFSYSSSNAAYLVNPMFQIARKGTKTIKVADVNSWESRIADEGFFYVRFDSNNKGNVTFVTEKPEEIIPVAPTNPCVLNSTELKKGDKLTMNLDGAFAVYRVNYADYKDAGLKLAWTGAEPLHTFVAETCEFAVAPYNRFVHAYEAIVANADAVLDINSLAAYVDADGYLYLRFLTEKEGVLEVK